VCVERERDMTCVCVERERDMTCVCVERERDMTCVCVSSACQCVCAYACACVHVSCVCVCLCHVCVCACVRACADVLGQAKTYWASKDIWERDGPGNRYASERGSIEKERERAGERGVVARGPRQRERGVVARGPRQRDPPHSPR